MGFSVEKTAGGLVQSRVVLIENQRMKNVEPILRENLLTLAGEYAKHRGVRLSTVAREAHGETTFFDVLKTQTDTRTDRRGSFTARKYDEIVAWFQSNWPRGLKFPPLHPVVVRRKDRSRDKVSARSVGEVH